MHAKKHWEKVYATNPTEELGWYRPHLETSLAWIKKLGLKMDESILDVGGGASSLVDDLVAVGYQSITVLDISSQALSRVKARLGEKAGLVTWLEGDITTIELPARHYKLWHDRALFHFLTERDQQQPYRAQLLKALRPGGHVILAAFAPEAPPRCSGLPVQRYTFELLEKTLGTEFELMRHHKEVHTTPGGMEQMYLLSHFWVRPPNV